MPVVPTLPNAAPPPPTSTEPVIPPPSGAIPTGPTQSLPPEPWYRKSGAVAGILLGFLVIAAIIIFLVVAGGGDDDADGVIDDIAPESVSLVITRLGSGDQPLNTTLSATVSAAPDADGYVWVIPDDAVTGQAGIRETDGTGRVEFRWAPSDIADASTWASTVEVAEFIASESDQPVTDLAVDCSLERDGATESIVVEATARFDEVNESLDTIGNYTFPNINLLAGDRVVCTATNIVADPAPVVTETATSVSESSTTVPETSTTVAETTTTVAETTTTVLETTTTTSTSTTTTTPTTEPPPAAPAVGDFLGGRSDLSEATALLDRVGMLDELESSDTPFTLFVPTNDAIEAARASADPPDFDDDAAVRALFEAHLHIGEQIDDPSTVAEIDVENGGPQPIDADANPITIGGVRIIGLDNQVDGGVVHIVDRVLPVQP